MSRQPPINPGADDPYVLVATTLGDIRDRQIVTQEKLANIAEDVVELKQAVRHAVTQRDVEALIERATGGQRATTQWIEGAKPQFSAMWDYYNQTKSTPQEFRNATKEQGQRIESLEGSRFWIKGVIATLGLLVTLVGIAVSYLAVRHP